MKIELSNPPNIEAISRVFNVKRSGVFFTYGNVIYNPSGVFISRELMAHEAVHGQRQVNPEAWWDRYFVDSEFRLNEELVAHVAEYKEFCNNHKDRNQRFQYLTVVASRLSGPLYNNMITHSEAMRRIFT